MRVAIALVALLTLTSGCADTEADIPAIERQIENGIHEQSDRRVAVDCPDSIEWQTGSDFHCLAEESSGGARYRITVSMENDDGEASWVVEN